MALLFLGAAAHPDYALPGLTKNTVAKAGEVHCKHVSYHELRRHIERVWPPSRWERGRPKVKAVAAWHRKLRCAAGPGHREAGKRRWLAARKAFFAHRALKIRQRERRRQLDALTPYDCGSAGSYAIPCYIVACESRYSWSAYNSSGAAGVYQIMPEWGRPWPVTTTADKLAHHRLAAKIWDGGAGASNWVCA